MLYKKQTAEKNIECINVLFPSDTVHMCDKACANLYSEKSVKQ